MVAVAATMHTKIGCAIGAPPRALKQRLLTDTLNLVRPFLNPAVMSLTFMSLTFISQMGYLSANYL
jgi:hypothetical protein